jgi:formamidopyrimidine-DNA glycosylase
MPELPEVETIARDLAVALVGVRVASVWGSGKGLHLEREVNLRAVRRALGGRRLVGVRRKGKYLLIDAEGERRPGVLVHLGMSGRLLVAAAESPRPPHTHLVLGLGAGRELRFVDPRRFGWLAAGAPVDGLPELGALGPDPLTELTAPELAAQLEGVRAPIKAFLLDQRRIAGLGNIYVSEALHRACIHPAVAAGRVQRRAAALLAGVRAALEGGIRKRGTTLRDYVDPSGARGDNAAALRVYGRDGEPCPVCATRIRRRVDGGRSTYLCPRCQRR